MIFVPLPVGVADPVERLRRVAAVTADRKRHVIPAPVGLPTRTRLVRRIMMRGAARQRWAAVYVADVPGPRTAGKFVGEAVLKQKAVRKPGQHVVIGQELGAALCGTAALHGLAILV